jgi:beta-galactosidase
VKSKKNIRLHYYFLFKLLRAAKKMSAVSAVLFGCFIFSLKCTAQRQRININEGWRFMHYANGADNLIYDTRPEVTDRTDNKAADSKPTEAITFSSGEAVLKKWILPTANNFIKDAAKRYQRPAGNWPGEVFTLVQNNFNDNSWQQVNLPHDWAIKQSFYKEVNATVGGGMGRLPVQGVAWYRKKINLPQTDKSKRIYLEVDGAMSYAMVWLNGQLVGGWPYGYNSFQLDLTPYIQFGKDNQLAIRIDNPNYSARWYPGAGLYRNVWLTKVNPVHVAQWGTFVTTKKNTATTATVDITVQLENTSVIDQAVEVVTKIFSPVNKNTPAAVFSKQQVTVYAGEKSAIKNLAVINKPLLWGPLPLQTPNLYTAITYVYKNGKQVDEYETQFGVRFLDFDAEKGLLVNGKTVRIQGVNQHHDLGALGAAFNVRAAQRQLEILAEAGCNAIRLAHNPPAPELLQLTDRMGFLVIDEIFDSWERKKTPHDFHLIFPDWYEADTRNFIQRDRNHPSVIAWSFGNEVGEQYTADTGALLAKKIYDIVKEEDDTRPATASMNYAKPDMPFPAVMDIISLNYQGEGIRDAPAYAHLKGIRTNPLYPAFHAKFPGKLIVSSETASALSTRGTYIFPVTGAVSAPVSDSNGGDPVNKSVSAYELYTAAFGSSADKVFASQDKHPFVAGEFVWSGWDYLGEPTPYYTARSSYCGFIDLAGFKKDRFYLYQARWRPNLPMAHLLPHWNWPGRAGKITPVHVFTSGDEAELFLNNKSLGRKKKNQYEYRLRWDDVVYEPGELKVVAYKNGSKWAQDIVKTSEEAFQLKISADRKIIKANGNDLAFITVKVTDKNGNLVPDAKNNIQFTIEGPAEIEATDNGDPANLVSFASTGRDVYAGLVLCIIRSKKNKTGLIKVKAVSPGLQSAVIEVNAK